MRILILTTKDNLYANYLVREVLQNPLLQDDEILVGEEKCLIPGKSFVAGLRTYLKESGVKYVFVQGCMQYLFVFMRFVHGFTRRKNSPFFPYRKTSHAHLQCKALSHLRTKKTQETIQSFHPDLILSLLSKEIIPQEVIACAPLGCWNIHTALLPEHRGMAPIFWAMAHGEKGVGCTLHRVDTGIDTGDILVQKSLPTAGVNTEFALTMRCLKCGLQLLDTALEQLKRGDMPTATPQRKTNAYHSRPTREAVAEFYRRGYVCFRWKELLSPQC